MKQIISANQTRFNEKYVRRDIEIERIKGKATVITGVRRCGKSTLLKTYIKDLVSGGVNPDRICQIDFADDRLVELKTGSPSVIADAYYELFPQNHGATVYFFFDEIYNVKDWELFVNRLQNTENCEINITGSSARLLVEETSTELGGRKMGWELFCYSYREFLRALGEEPQSLYLPEVRDKQAKLFDRYLATGGFPEALQFRTEKARTIFLQNTCNDIGYRDIVLRKDISKPAALRTMVILLFGMMGQRMSITKLYQRLMGMKENISKPLVTEYLDYITETFAVYLMPIRSYNQAVRATNEKKVYLADHAMAAAVVPGMSQNEGAKIENIVYLHLRRKTPEVFYYRTASGKEVDFAAGPDGDITLIQVSTSIQNPETLERELRALREAMAECNQNTGYLLTKDTESTLTFPEGTVKIMPVWKHLLPDR